MIVRKRSIADGEHTSKQWNVKSLLIVTKLVKHKCGKARWLNKVNSEAVWNGTNRSEENFRRNSP